MVKYPQFWMVFFGPGANPGRFARWLSPRWQHVCCASFQPDKDLWLYVNPARDRTYVLAMTPTEFNAHFGHLLNTSTAILEFPVEEDRRFSPTWASCVGMVKGIMGIRAWAFTPYGLYRDLLKRGAESFGPEEPAREANVYEFDIRRRRAQGTAGRSERGPPTADRGSAGGSGTDQGHAEPA